MISAKGNIIELNGDAVKVHIKKNTLCGTVEYEGTAANDCSAVVGDFVSIQIHSKASVQVTVAAYMITFLIALAGMGLGAIVYIICDSTIILLFKCLVLAIAVLCGAIFVRCAMRAVRHLDALWRSKPTVLSVRKVLGRKSSSK